MFEEPEAVEAITKFNILHDFGSSYTWSNLDEERNRNILLMGECVKAYNAKIEMDNFKSDFRNKEMLI